MNCRPLLARLSRLLRASDGKADSKLPGLLMILFLGVGGYVGWNYFVPYFNNRQLTDYVKDYAVYDPFEKSKPSEETVKAAILKKMRELGIRFNENDREQKLEVIPKTELAFEVNLRYKEIIQIYGMNPKTKWYEIHFDGTEMAKAIIPDQPVE